MLKKIFTLLVLLYAFASFAAAVDVNKATAAELDSIKGIGPAMSGKILDERKKIILKIGLTSSAASKAWARPQPPSCPVKA